MQLEQKKLIKRIGIDARLYGPLAKGIGRYIKEVLDIIIKIDKENYYVIFLSKDNFDQFICNNERIKKILVNVRWYTFAEQIIMPWLIFKEKLDLMHFPHFNIPIFCPVKFIVTIHDLISIKFPTDRATTLGPLAYKIKNLALRFIIWFAINRAGKVIAVSEFTKKDIIDKFKIAKEKIEVTYEAVGLLATSPSIKQDKGIDKGSKKEDRAVLLKYYIDKPYLLYVGNAYPHKNLEGLVEVFSRIIIKNPNIQLVLVSKDDYFYKRIKDYAKSLKLYGEGSNSQIVFPGYVTDEELKVLYKNALLYVFPSFYEGFGLPPLEAMANGCPIVSSNQTSLPEILGQAALYFNPNDQKDMEEKIESLLKDENLRRNLINQGYEQIKKYSWQECAEKTLAVYQEIIN